MNKYLNPNQPYLLLIIIIVGIFSLKLAEIFLFTPIIEDAYTGDSFNYLNHLLEQHRLKDPDNRTLGFYLTEISSYTNRLILLGIFFSVLSWLIVRNDQKLFKKFFYETDRPFNLAFLRIVVVLFVLYINFPSASYNLSLLDREALVAPPGWSFLIQYIPVNPEFIFVCSIVFYVAGIAALVGFYTRTSLIIFAILGFCLLGFPQLFGKIEHYHILWHVMLLLAFTPCGHALSIDLYLSNKPAPGPSVKYGFPLKVVMVLIALSYFFPGIWKFVFSGFEWAFSENLKFKMYSKWIEFGGWTPAFRIDQYPILYQGTAFITLIFEIGFLFALFFKRVRPMFVVTGFLFHVSVFYFMGIPFYSLMIMYVVFIDWHKLFSGLKKMPEKLVDPNYSSKLSKSVKIVAIVLIAGNFLTGALLINSWPFSVNPTFASMETGQISTLMMDIEVEGESENEAVFPLFNEKFHDAFNSVSRLRGFLDTVIRSKNPKPESLKTLASIQLQDINQTITSVKFYHVIISTDPDVRNTDYKKERLLGEMNI